MKKYQIIYADPPWSYDDKKNNDPAWGAMTYHTMTTEEICALPIKDLADENCMIFIWATFPNLPEVFKVIEAWGFEYKTLGFSWIKTNKNDGRPFFGIGYYTKSNCEVCLIGIKGKPIKVSDLVSSVVIEPISGHSRKPDTVRDRIVELCGDIPGLELFARDYGDIDLFGKNRMDGWDTWGNEVKNDIEL